MQKKACINGAHQKGILRKYFLSFTSSLYNFIHTNAGLTRRQQHKLLIWPYQKGTKCINLCHIRIKQWALNLSLFENNMAHVPGEIGCFPDLLTRWGAKSAHTRQLLSVSISTTMDSNFNIDSFVSAIKKSPKGLPLHEKQSPDINFKI